MVQIYKLLNKSILKHILLTHDEAVHTKNRLNSYYHLRLLDYSEIMIHGHHSLTLAKLSLMLDLSNLKWFALKHYITTLTLDYWNINTIIY